MGADEKAAFEKQLNTDPELQQEFQLQQKIADSLREARVSELKTMLNNVPASALKGSNVSVLVKLAIGFVASAIVATGLYFYFEQPEETKVEVVVIEEPKIETSEPVETTEPQPEPEAKSQTQSTNVEEKKIEKTQPQKTKKATKPDITVAKPAIDVFDPAVESDSQSVSPVSEKVPVEKPSHGSSIALGIDKDNKKYTFNYQFKDDSLLLFGPFEKNVYEIMEFFSEDNKRTIFLFYKDHYYFLKEDGEKIKPLKAISDPTLIKKLKDSRKK
ncbi:MAG TPA: hypothetical protein PLY70_14190 [Saprospiraceae bacterium]|nr:hypothetical protein [Saprospiraceae bacterium]